MQARGRIDRNPTKKGSHKPQRTALRAFIPYLLGEQAVLVRTKALKTGYVLKRDIFAKSSHPLIKAGTVLQEIHIEFLKAFLVDQVDVSAVKMDHKTVRARRMAEIQKKETASSRSRLPKKESGHSETGADDQWIRQYRHHFKSWQSGSSVDIGSFRKLSLPLIQAVLDNPQLLARLLIHGTTASCFERHCLLMGLLAAFFGKKMNLEKGMVYQLGLAGMLADCGMAKIPRALMEKGGSLTGPERKLYESHVSESYKMLKDLPTMREEALLAVIQHHEYEDGSGFPLHLRRDTISREGKILAFCAAYLDEITHSPGTGSIVRALDSLKTKTFGKLSVFLINNCSMELMTLFSGMNVSLSDGRSGTIIFIPDKTPTRPLIRLKSKQVLALTGNPHLAIEEIKPG